MFSKLVSKTSHQASKRNSPFFATRSVPNTQNERNNRSTNIDEDCSYDEDYSYYTESENSSKASSFVPQDLFYDPFEEEYDYGNDHHNTSSNMRAQKATFENVIL
jgi:hypothetical protein